MPIKYAINNDEERGIAVLKIVGELDFECRNDFHAATSTLLGQEQEKLVIDITNLHKLSSMYIGTLVDVSRKAKDSNKVLAVIGTKKAANLCEMIGVSESLQMIVKKD